MCIHVRIFFKVVFVIPCLLAAWMATGVLAAPPQPASGGRWTPAEISGIDRLVEAATLEVKRTGSPSQIAAFDDVRDVMAHASEWRWYTRDSGILLAIPVRERLGIAAKVEGETALADVVRRLINQAGWGNPPVQVVLVASEEPRQERRLDPPCEPVRTFAPCGCE